MFQSFYVLLKNKNIMSKEIELCRKWIRACGTRIKIDLSIAKVCSQHFRDDGWESQNIILNIPKEKRKLKEGAIPSINKTRTKYSNNRNELIKELEQKEVTGDALCNYNKKPVMEMFAVVEEPEVNADELTAMLEHPTIRMKVDPLAVSENDSQSLQLENKQLEIQLKELRKRLHSAETAISSLEQIFTEGQMKRVKNHKRMFKWSFEDILHAASLYSTGPIGYAQLIKMKYPLPSQATLKKWTERNHLKRGIIESAINILSNHTFVEQDRLCILLFHEIQLKVDLHEPPSEWVEQHTSAQVFIIRGLIKDWKQIIYYNYDCPRADVILREIAQILKSINLTVVAVVSGVGLLKMPLWVEMHIDKDHPSAEVIDGEKVFFFGNVPDLIKNFRNVFVDMGFVVNGKWVNMEPLKELLHPDMPDLELDFVLSESHICSKKINRQKEILAWQLLSHSVVSAIRKCVSMGKMYSQNAIECSDLIELFANWLDVFNAKDNMDGKIKERISFGWSMEDPNETIAIMDEFMNSICRTNSRVLYPFQRGILLNNKSLVQLRSYLKQRFDVEFVVTNRFNQDDLGHKLGIRRSGTGIGGLLTSLEFEHQINASVLRCLQNGINN